MGQLGWLLLQDRIHRFDGRLSTERPLACQCLVEDAPEGEEVRAVIRAMSLHLFRGHVPDGSEHDAGIGSPRCRNAA